MENTEISINMGTFLNVILKLAREKLKYDANSELYPGTIRKEIKKLQNSGF